MTPHSSLSAHRRQQAAPWVRWCFQQDRLKLLSPPLCRVLPTASPQTEGLMRGIAERLARSVLPARCKRWEGLRCISCSVRKLQAVTARTKPCPHPYVSSSLLGTFLSVCCRQAAVEGKRSRLPTSRLFRLHSAFTLCLEGSFWGAEDSEFPLNAEFITTNFWTVQASFTA